MAATIKDLGKVTAYAYAKAAGYTGTEEQFQAIFNEFTENAPGLMDRMDTAVARAEAAVTNIDATVQDAVDDAVEEATASAVATANQAVTDAQAAQAAAEGAVTQANAAVTQANSAVSAAQAAQAAAEDAAESFVLDRTLTDSGAAAPADLVGNLKESTNDLKTAITQNLSTTATLTGIPVVIPNANETDSVSVTSTNGTKAYITGTNVLDMRTIGVGTDTYNVKNLCVPFTVYLDFDVSNDFAQSTSVWVIYVAWKDGTKRYISDDSNSSVRTLTATVENPIVEIYERSTNITAGSISNIRVTRKLGSAYTAYNGKTVDFPAQNVSLFDGENIVWANGSDCTVVETISDGRIKNIESDVSNLDGYNILEHTVAYTASTYKYETVDVFIPKDSRVRYSMTGSIFADNADAAWGFLDNNGNTFVSLQRRIIGKEYEITLDQDAYAVRTYVTGEYITSSGNAVMSIDLLPITERTAVLESYHAEELPEPDSYYFEDDYLPNKITAINDYAKGAVGNGDAFVFITDQHWAVNAQKSPSLIKYIADNTNITTVVNGGDVADGGSDDYVSMLQNTGMQNIYYLNGNHDPLKNANGNVLAYMYDMRNPHVVSGDPYNRYYYFDNNRAKIRYICLSTNGDSATEILNADQLNWFTNTALNVESGWSIVVLIHYLYMINWQTNTVPIASSGATSFMNAIDAYDGNGKIIAVFQGHAHRDRITHTTGGVPVIMTTCDKYRADTTQSGTDIDVTRTKGTITEQAFDVVIIDIPDKTIHLVRIGAKAEDGVDGDPGDEVEERTVTWN